MRWRADVSADVRDETDSAGLFWFVVLGFSIFVLLVSLGVRI